MNTIRRFIKILALSFLPVGVSAETLTVNLRDLGSALSDSRSEQDAVQQLVLDKIQTRLNELDLQFEDNELLIQDELRDELVEDGCTSTEIQQMSSEIALSGDTGFELTIDSLFDPIKLSLSLSANINTVGRARQVFGFRLGRCREVASDSFDFNATGPLNIALELSIALNPTWIADDTLRVTPQITIDGELRESNITVNVDDTLLRGLLERFLQSEVDDLFSAANFRSELADLQTGLDEQLSSDLSDSIIDIELPRADDEQIAALYELLTPQARFPLTVEFLQQRRLEILAALIFDDQDRIAQLLEDAAYCELTDQLQVELTEIPVYEQINGICEVSDGTRETTLYSDAACALPFEYYPTSFSEFCAVTLNSDRLGNARSNPENLLRWSRSPGNAFEVGVSPISGKVRPFVQRVNYKNVGTDQGNCSLEMRIYTSDPSARNLKPLIALHGGSWQNRGTGFLGVENMATHFTDAGFVVFAPFYRLVHDSDGSSECHNATLEQLLADVDDAFSWVEENKDRYGAAGKSLLFGQSAGGHLALHLAINRAPLVKRAMLFYAPTDFEDFGRQIQSGEYINETGTNIMQRVTGSDIDQLDLQSDLVRSNTFPSIVAAQPDAFPPMFLLHGESDTLLPSRQSVRLCNGLSGNVEAGPAPYDFNTSSTQRTFACDDRGSQLHLIAQGEHTLDLCISDELCFAGSPASAAATETAVNQMLDWSSADSLLQVASSGQRRQGAGSVSMSVLLILLVSVCRNFKSY